MVLVALPGFDKRDQGRIQQRSICSDQLAEKGQLSIFIQTPVDNANISQRELSNVIDVTWTTLKNTISCQSFGTSPRYQSTSGSSNLPGGQYMWGPVCMMTHL